MFRTLWTLLIGWNWVRSALANRKEAKVGNTWEAAVKRLGLKPGRNESIENQVRYAIEANEVDKIGNRAKEATARALTRLNKYNRVRNFGSRSFWSFLPYVEVASLGVLGAWMFKHNPDGLAWAFNVIHQSLGVAWAGIEGVGNLWSGMEGKTLDGSMTAAVLAGTAALSAGAVAVVRRFPSGECWEG